MVSVVTYRVSIKAIRKSYTGYFSNALLAEAAKWAVLKFTDKLSELFYTRKIGVLVYVDSDIERDSFLFPPSFPQEDIKGLRSTLNPAIKQLKAETLYAAIAEFKAS